MRKMVFLVLVVFRAMRRFKSVFFGRGVVINVVWHQNSTDF